MCTNFKELKINLVRFTGLVYVHKEHGDKWMQQNIIFMYGLYEKDFFHEGFQVFKDVFQLCTNSALARNYPGVPFYFDPVDH